MTEYKDYEGKALEWDDEIEEDGQEFIILPPGDYEFMVSNLERERHPGSEKLPPCNKARITLDINYNGQTVKVFYNLFLHSKVEGMLSAFFRALNLKNEGEKIVMPWGEILGKKGRCKIQNRKWVNADGREMTFNEVSRMYPYEAPKTPKYSAGKF